MPIVNRIADMQAEVAAWRRDIHAHPEILFDVHRTAASVAEKLKAFGCDEVVSGIGKTGVVGVIRGRRAATARKVIGLRADMDALPMDEQTNLPYRSTNPGKMHACGHDGHTAMLLGAAKYLAETRNFSGTAVVIFQPAEEGGGGGYEMVKDGMMERFGIEEVYGMHNMPGLPVGEFAIRPGPMLAAADRIIIEIEGLGSHAAQAASGHRPGGGRRADRQPGAVDRVAQRRSDQIGPDLDLPVPRRLGRQRHPADRDPARHRAQPVARGARHAGEPAAPDRRGNRQGLRRQGDAHLQSALSGDEQSRAADRFRRRGRRRSGRAASASTPTRRR